MMKRLLLGIAVAMSCRTFQYFPGMGPVQEGWFVACFVYLLFIYPFFKAQTGWRLSKFELYILALMAIVPFLSAFSSWQQFGQPFSYGFLAQRGVILLAGALMLMQGFQHRFFTLKDIENSLVGLGWVVSVVHLLMRAFLNPADYLSYGPGFVTDSPDHVAFVLPIFFPAFVLLYYSFLGCRTRQIRYYCFAPLFLVALLNNNGARALTTSLLIAFLFLVYRWGGMTRATMLFCRMVLVTALALGTVYLISPETIVTRAGKFQDAFTVAVTGKEVQDLSATLRIY